MRLAKTTAPATARGSRGFTLTEAIVGVGVVGILLVSLYGGLTSALNVIQLAREDKRATEILVRTMDQLRLYNWEQVTNDTAIPTAFLEPFNPDLDPPVVAGHGNGHGKGGKGKSGTVPPLVY